MTDIRVSGPRMTEIRETDLQETTEVRIIADSLTVRGDLRAFVLQETDLNVGSISREEPVEMEDLRETNRMDFRDLRDRVVLPVSRVTEKVLVLARVATVVLTVASVMEEAMKDREVDSEIKDRARALWAKLRHPRI